MQRLTGVAVPSNKAIVGSGLYQIESGIIASWFKNCGEKNATELFPIRWSAVGQPPAEIVMGKGSGIDSVNAWLRDVGMQVSEEDAMKVLQATKLHSLKNKKMLSARRVPRSGAGCAGANATGGGVGRQTKTIKAIMQSPGRSTRGFYLAGARRNGS